MNGRFRRPAAARAAWLAMGVAVTAGASAAHAGVGYDEALRLASERAPSLVAQQAALAGARSLAPAAATLPDPKLAVGIENLPINGPDRWSLGREGMTMQRIGVMQEVPNRAKRQARSELAQARIERERATLAAAELVVRREAGLAWIGLHYAQARLEPLAELDRENRLLLETVDARIASGSAMPAERTMARQETLALADRRDDVRRDIERARAALRRWIGDRAEQPLDGPPPPIEVDGDRLLAALHHHAELRPYTAMTAMARAEVGEAQAEKDGDWSWELAYSRRPDYSDMVSFQFRFDLPWQKEVRQQPQVAARQKEAERIEAEREESLRRHREELEAQLAELKALDAQRTRLQTSGHALAAERVALALASYQSGRGDLAGVLMARREAADLRMRTIELDAQRLALRLRLSTLIAE